MTFVGQLLPYQTSAFNLMVDRRNVLLAYEMGLGKTVVTIAAVEQLMDDYQIVEPGIVVCLSSLKFQWAKAITKFTEGSSTPLVIDGTPKQREAQYAYAQDWMANGVDYVILNYEQIVNDWDLVKQLPRGFVVADEVTAVKSFRSHRSKRLKKLRSDINFALTGTPVENGKPEEIYSIMQFVDPDVLGRFDLFDKTFIVRSPWGGVERYRNLPTLHKTLSTAMVRKRQTDADVAPYLPDVLPSDPEDRKLQVDLDPAGRKLYRHIAGELLADLADAQQLFGGSFSVEAHYGVGTPDGGAADEMRGRIMAKVTALRMLCDHPGLLMVSAGKAQNYEGGSQYCYELGQRGLLDGRIRTPKLDALTEYVTSVLEDDASAKVVIFTQYREMVALIQDALRKYGSREYTGSLNAKAKEANKLEFQNDPTVRLLISTDAGGYGVDLPQANVLINYDQPWAAGTAAQRDSRIIRASSEHKRVYLRDLLVKGTIEERNWLSLQAKKAVATAIVDGHGTNDRGGVDLTVTSLTEFLRSA